jgi:predicted acetyltransferase
MEYRLANSDDLPQLARMNQQLIRDESSSNRMTLGELEARMRGWLRGTYQAVLLSRNSCDVGYALFRHESHAIFLRQFFIIEKQRRQGLGREAFETLQREFWGTDAAIRLEVLSGNQPAHAFWRALGFRDYSIAMDWEPEADNANTKRDAFSD